MRHSFKSTLYLRLATHLVEIYPASWRERYSEEMLLLLEEYPPTFKTIINLFLHLFDAYTHQHLVKGRTSSMLQKIRSSELAIYGATIIFFFASLIAEACASSMINTNMYISLSLYSLLENVLFILPLFILLGGLPMLLATSWKAWQARNLRVLLLLLSGLLCPSITVFLILHLLRTGLNDPWLASLYILILGINLAALISFAVQSIPSGRRVTHLTLYLATPLPVIMLVGLALVLLRIVPAFTTGRITSYYMDNQGYVVYTMFLTFLIMIVTFSFVLVSLLRGFQAKQHTQPAL